MRSSLFIISVCILLLGGTYVRSEDAKNESKTDGIAWGKVINGLQLGISPPVKLDESHEFDGFEEPVIERDTLQVTVHLRNAGTSDVRFLPTVWDCLALGDDGAIPVSKIILTPESGGDSLTIIYKGMNHLERLRDKRAREPDSSEETPSKNISGAKVLELTAKRENARQIKLAAGDALWPEWVKVNPKTENNTQWRLAKEPGRIPPGKYCVTAVLIVNQKVSEWKGRLMSGNLDIEIPVPARP